MKTNFLDKMFVRPKTVTHLTGPLVVLNLDGVCKVIQRCCLCGSPMILAEAILHEDTMESVTALLKEVDPYGPRVYIRLNGHAAQVVGNLYDFPGDKPHDLCLRTLGKEKEFEVN